MTKSEGLSAWPRGSEWRKWDLHVHTPFSALNNGFGDDFDEYAKLLLTAAVEKNMAAVGITDYFCIDGYAKLRGLLESEERLEELVGRETALAVRRILFLPNIELRTNIIVRDSDGRDSRVGLHIIFSNDIPPATIQERFLRDLKFTVEASPGAPDESWSLTVANLRDLGEKLKAQHEEFAQYDDVFVGMMNAVVDHTMVTKVLEDQASIFRNRYVICLPCDEDLSECNWDGQGHLTRKLLLQKAHFLFSSNWGTHEFGLGRRHDSVEQFLSEFATLKPCIHGSDAHTPGELFEPDEGRYTWICADPTFLGLRQVLSEPEDRVSIGEKPEFVTHLPGRASLIADSVRITNVESYSGPEKWFDVSVPLNSGLVAIIGNKGSGKSALAETIGLVGNTPRYDSFSFLCDGKFRDPKNNKAKHFEATLAWADGSVEGSVNLAANPATHAVEKVKYIPQNYLEEICNEIERGKESRFLRELEEVIFSHVPEPDRLDYGTLGELLAYKTGETHHTIELLVRELREANQAIVALEEKLDPSYRDALNAQLKEKNRELEALKAAEPREKPKPGEDEEAQEKSQAISHQLEAKRETLRDIDEKLKEREQQRTDLTKRR